MSQGYSRPATENALSFVHSFKVLASFLFIAAAPPVFTAPPIERFDGQGWGEIRFGQTTDAELKAKWATRKSPLRPEAIRLEAQGGVVIDVLLDGRGGEAKAQGIRLALTSPPDLRRMGILYGDEPEVRYFKTRYEGKQLLVFPKSGVFCYHAPGEDTTIWFLVRPDRLQEELQDTSTKPTALSPVPDPGAGWDRVGRYGFTDVDVSISGNNRPRGISRLTEDRVEWRLDDALRSFGERNRVRYTPGESGRYDIEINGGKWDSRGTADFSVSASLSVDTPYGRVTESVYDSERCGGSLESRLVNLGYGAIYELERKMGRRLANLGPPSPTEAEEARMQALYTRLSRP